MKGALGLISVLEVKWDLEMAQSVKWLPYTHTGPEFRSQHYFKKWAQ